MSAEVDGLRRKPFGGERLSPFPWPMAVGWLDGVVRRGQIWQANVRRRTPPLPPWRNRSVRAWQTDKPDDGPSEPSKRTRPLILGLTAAWNEDDVIWATVRNLYAQGVDEVFVIDDESSDATRAEACAAGATVVDEVSSGVFNEGERTRRILRVIDQQTGRVGGDVWWIVVDADEFPRGPEAMTIRQVVERLPDWVDVVGSRVLEHLPASAATFQPRTHPVLWLPLARWYDDPYCPHGHWKHQLFRVRTPGDVYPIRGRHTIATGDRRRAREAAPSLLMHHVPLRDRARTEAKLRAAAAGRYLEAEDFTRLRLIRRLQTLDDLYNGRLGAVPNDLAGEPLLGIACSPWQELVPDSERALPDIDAPPTGPSRP